MKKITLKECRPSRPRLVELMIAVNLVLFLMLFRVGAAEITAMAILIRELRHWRR